MKKNNHKEEVQVNEEVEIIEGSAVDEDNVSTAEGVMPEDGDALPDMELSDDDADVDPLEAENAALRAERDELKDQALRARAEFDNYRKRMARESERIRKTAAEGLLRDLLPIVDNLERALSHVEDKSDGLALGVEMVVRQFSDILSGKGLEPIPAKGEPFDPNIHEALTHQPSDEFPADTVMEEFQRGYRLGDFVLRPAQVVVSSGPAATKDGNVAEETTSTEAPASDTAE